MKHLLLGLGLFSSLAVSAQSLNWGLSDASILFPLPENLEKSALLKAASDGPQKTLLSKDIYRQLPRLADHENSDRLYENLSAVALRIDPPKKEIRIVFQPLETSFIIMGDDIVTKALDMAVHAFYRLSDQDFQSFIQSYQKLRSQYSVTGQLASLGIHPKLREEKMLGGYSTGLKELILKTVGEKKMYRVTFMRLESIGGIWKFGGFDVSKGKLTPFQIPRLKSTTQSFTNVGRGSFLAGDIEPAPRGKDTFNSILEEKIKDASQADTLIKEVRAAFRVEDPKVHTTETVDCVSCHTARLVRHWAFGKYPEVLSKELWPEVEPTDGLTLNNMRIFGYLDDKPSISQRVINETAEIVRDLNSL